MKKIVMTCYGKARTIHPIVLIASYVLIFTSIIYVVLIFHTDIDYSYKGISALLSLKLLFLSFSLWLFFIGLLFRKEVLRVIGITLCSNINNGHDTSLKLLHQIKFDSFDLCIYRDIPTLCVDPYSILVRQEYDVQYGIKKEKREREQEREGEGESEREREYIRQCGLEIRHARRKRNSAS